MKFLALTILLVIASANATPAIGGAPRVVLPVAVYYEHLCPDSIRFISNELFPNFEGLKDFIDVLFVPFGKASSVDGGQGGFICQHGPPECAGNKIQSCTLNFLDDPVDRVNFVACQMQFNNDRSGESCVRQSGRVSWGRVLECFNNGEGLNLQLEAERLTQAVQYPYPSFVPTIVFNNVFDQDLQDRALSDFKGVVCELISNAAPVC